MLLEIMIYLRHDLASVCGKTQSTMKYSLLKRGNLSRFIETRRHDSWTNTMFENIDTVA